MQIEANKDEVKVVVNKDGSEYHVTITNDDVIVKLFDKDGKEVNQAAYYYEHLCPSYKG